MSAVRTVDSEEKPRGFAPDAHPRSAIDAFGEIAAALGEAVGLDELLHLVARKMCELVDVKRCGVFLRDQDSGLFRGQACHADRDLDAVIKRMVGGHEADRFTREIVDTRGPVVLHDALRDQRAVRSTMRAWQVRSMMGVPMVVGDEVTGVLFLYSVQRSRRFSAADAELATVFARLAAIAVSQGRLVAELREERDTADRHNRAYRRAAAVGDHLVDIVVAGGGLSEIANEVTRLTGKPCGIYDPGLRCLVSVGGPGDLARLSLTAPEVSEIKELACEQPTVVGPCPAASVGRRLLIMPVAVRGTRWANLVLAERGSGLTALDRLIARRAAEVTVLAMSAERRAMAADSNVRRSFAADLLRGDCDRRDLERRASHLGIHLDQPRVVCLIAPHHGDPQRSSELDVEALVGEIAERCHAQGLLATGMPEGVAVLIELPGARAVRYEIDEVKARVASACTALDPARRWAIGVSKRCHQTSHYSSSYRQVRQVVSCIDRYCSPTGTQALSVDDLGASRLLLSGTDPVEARRFTDETLGELLSAGRPPELLETLVCFFENGRNFRRSATALGVHENTVRYRLTRVGEVIGLDVSANSDAQLSAQVALLVLKLQGALATRSPATRQQTLGEVAA